MKKCSMCNYDFPSNKEFFHSDRGKKDGLSSRCKACSNSARKAWVENNRDKHIEYHSKYRQENRERISKTNREQYLKNREYRLQYAKSKQRERRNEINERARERYKNCPKTKISFSVSSRIRRSLKGGSKGIFRHLPYTKEDLVEHLEQQFDEGMSWENYGEWHIDHIIPIASFKYESIEDEGFIECWSLSNLRPLWAKENLSKGKKITHLI